MRKRRKIDEAFAFPLSPDPWGNRAGRDTSFLTLNIGVFSNRVAWRTGNSEIESPEPSSESP